MSCPLISSWMCEQCYSHHYPGWPGTQYVDQSGLELPNSLPPPVHQHTRTGLKIKLQCSELLFCIVGSPGYHQDSQILVSWDKRLGRDRWRVEKQKEFSQGPLLSEEASKS